MAGSFYVLPINIIDNYWFKNNIVHQINNNFYFPGNCHPAYLYNYIYATLYAAIYEKKPLLLLITL
jgi:hypothetical protein